MKRQLLLTLAILLIPAFVFAGDVSFMWDANTEPDLAGYRIYMHTGGGSYDYTQPPVIECIGVGATVSNLVEGETYSFVLRAFDTEALESGNSNELTWYEPFPYEGVPPANPQSLRFVQ
jgi:hypothetical protein